MATVDVVVYSTDAGMAFEPPLSAEVEQVGAVEVFGLVAQGPKGIPGDTGAEGKEGLQGPIGPQGPEYQGDDLPDFTLIFENKLV